MSRTAFDCGISAELRLAPVAIHPRDRPRSPRRDRPAPKGWSLRTHALASAGPLAMMRRVKSRHSDLPALLAAAFARLEHGVREVALDLVRQEVERIRTAGPAPAVPPRPRRPSRAPAKRSKRSAAEVASSAHAATAATQAPASSTTAVHAAPAIDTNMAAPIAAVPATAAPALPEPVTAPVLGVIPPLNGQAPAAIAPPGRDALAPIPPPGPTDGGPRLTGDDAAHRGQDAGSAPPDAEHRRRAREARAARATERQQRARVRRRAAEGRAQR